MNAEWIEHLRAMIALHEVQATLAEDAKVRRAHHTCARDYEHRIAQTLTRQTARTGPRS